MSESSNVLAWLDQPSGERVPILSTCSIGRLSSNSVMLPDDRVSRRHALISVQSRYEFWLVDLGSGNGTYLNGKRVAQPARLRDGDQIDIPPFQLLFHQANSGTTLKAPAHTDNADGKTLREIKPTHCWLLVADIEGSTQLMKKGSEANLPLVTDRWFDACKQLVENHGGTVNKFLGDGFFAYWQKREEGAGQVARALQALQRLQQETNPPFRVVVHFGQVFVGGAGSLGEENLQGKEVHFVFRMEKLAGQIRQHCLISDAAKALLPSWFGLSEAGHHPVAGFDGEHLFHTNP